MAIISAELLTDEEVLGDYDVYDLDRSDGELWRTSQFGVDDPSLRQIKFDIISTPEAPTADLCAISYEPNSGITSPLLRNIIIDRVDGCSDDFTLQNTTLIDDKSVS